MSWKTEFNAAWKPPQALLDLVATGEAQDLSDEHDTAPSFGVEEITRDAAGEMTEKRVLAIGSDHPVPAKRTEAKSPRYTVFYLHERVGASGMWGGHTVDQQELLTTDSIRDAIDAYRRAKRRYHLDGTKGEVPAPSLGRIVRGLQLFRAR